MCKTSLDLSRNFVLISKYCYIESNILRFLTRITSFDIMAKKWDVFPHMYLQWPNLHTSHCKMIWRTKVWLFLVSRELEKQNQQNSSSSTCALSLLTYLPGFNNKYLKLIQSWKHLVRFVFMIFHCNKEIQWNKTPNLLFQIRQQ